RIRRYRGKAPGGGPNPLLNRCFSEARQTMARYDFRSPRLFVEPPLAAGAVVPLAPPQAHYLKDVLRLKPGDGVLVFNGRDGEWHGRLDPVGKRSLALQIDRQTRPQT